MKYWKDILLVLLPPLTVFFLIAVVWFAPPYFYYFEKGKFLILLNFAIFSFIAVLNINLLLSKILDYQLSRWSRAITTFSRIFASEAIVVLLTFIWALPILSNQSINTKFALLILLLVIGNLVLASVTLIGWLLFQQIYLLFKKLRKTSNVSSLLLFEIFLLIISTSFSFFFFIFITFSSFNNVGL